MDNEAATHIDELAERLLSFGGQPIATMREYIEQPSSNEAKGSEDCAQMVQSIIIDYTTIIEELKQGMSTAEEVRDETAGDMLLAIHSVLGKHV